MIFKNSIKNKAYINIILFFVIFLSFFLKIFSKELFVYAEVAPTLIEDVNVYYEPLTRNYEKGKIIVPQYIIIHDTGNRAATANARANRNYFETTSTEVSAHFLVDDGGIIQALPETAMGWHVGDGYNKGYSNASNSNTIGIELCVNQDSDFGVTFQNGIKLTRYLMEKYDIPVENVIRHYDVSRKICPRIMIEDDPSLWVRFKEEIQKKEELIIENTDNNDKLNTENNTENNPIHEERKSNYIPDKSSNARIVTNDVPVLLQPSTNIEEIDYIYQGSLVKVIESIGTSYCKIKYNDIEGYIPFSNVKLLDGYSYDKKGVVKNKLDTKNILTSLLSLGIINENSMKR